MPSIQQIWQYLRQHRGASIIVGHVMVLGTLGLVLLSSTMGTSLFGAFAQASCAPGDRAYTVSSGDTLGSIAGRFHSSWQAIASHSKLANANVIYAGQRMCIPGGATQVQVLTNKVSNAANKGAVNTYPYGTCTWYANQRFYQLHGYYVPWTMNANAWQWTTRAYQYGWHVSSTPTAGAIIDLQPGVQGASYSMGHVATVEKVLGNGHVIASSMNWGAFPNQITSVDFATGPGVTFIGG
jgi:N-acetylmuramoyl-L-alanine amidase